MVHLCVFNSMVMWVHTLSLTTVGTLIHKAYC